MRNVDASASRKRWRWLWAVGALVAVCLAFALTSANFQKVPLFGIIHNKYNESYQGSRWYTGLVEGCCCDYETVDSLNEQVLHPILQDLVTTPFIRYFKAADYLEQAEYNTGNPEEDQKTESLVRQLLYNLKLQAACPLPFDEAKLWQGKSGPQLKQQVQKQFRNISALMDCVGCEKCRLWGKLQVLGLGTALKILFSVNGERPMNEPLQLQRNEVIALVNLLNSLSESVEFVRKMGPQVDKLMVSSP